MPVGQAVRCGWARVREALTRRAASAGDAGRSDVLMQEKKAKRVEPLRRYRVGITSVLRRYEDRWRVDFGRRRQLVLRCVREM